MTGPDLTTIDPPRGTTMKVTLKKLRPADLAYGDHAAEQRQGGTYAVVIDGDDTGYRVAADGYAKAWEPMGWEVLDRELRRVRGSYETRREAVKVAVSLRERWLNAYREGR